MGRLIPDDLDTASLEHSERRVVEALVEGTSPEWCVVPSVHFVDDRGRDGEADVVLLHPTFGMLVVETKGGEIQIAEGVWFQNGSRLDKTPVEQAMRAKYALIQKIKAATRKLGTERLLAAHAVALPDATDCPPGALGVDLTRPMVFTAAELQWPDVALAALLSERPPVTSEMFERSVRVLRPDVAFSTDPNGVMRATQRRLGDQTLAILRIAEQLDLNQRVAVDGPAGSGKTRLASSWARRAAERGERVLLLSFNLPIGAWLTASFERQPLVTAGSFHRTVAELLAPAGFVEPADPSPEFFATGYSDAIQDLAPVLEHRFDTIILDEVQDFRPEWLAALPHLLDADGPARQFRLGDQSQNIYGVAVEELDGWVQFRLTDNCRNTRPIAEVAERLGGGGAVKGCPAGQPVQFTHATGKKEIRKRVAETIAHLVDALGVPPSTIAVATTRSELRDDLLASDRQTVPLVRWEDRDEGSVLCENVHRLKGMEFQAVVLASVLDADHPQLRDLLYVGASRATTYLHVIAPRETAALMGIGDPTAEQP